MNKIKHLDFIKIKPYKGCKFGLARVFTRKIKRKEILIAEGICIDETGKPISFSVDISSFKYQIKEV